MSRKPVHKECRIHNFQAQSQEPPELQKARSQDIYVNLEGIGKVNEHVLGLFLPAGNIETGSHHVNGSTTLYKILFHGNTEQAVSGIDKVTP
eukprot:scaffold185_cov42-Attheya_sp.AAC.3